MTYSQSGEDAYLQNTVFRNKTDGWFVEVGADDGIRYSNTLLFEQLGWQGTCYEPVPSSFQQCQMNRRCKVINAAIVGFDMEQVFTIDTKHPDISGFRRTQGIQHAPRKLSLNTAIDRPIDLLSIDTEGTEVDILKAFSFRIAPRVIVVEYDTIHIGQCEQELVDLLTSKNYVLINKFEFNLIFMKA